jgi:hypothetical protein
VFLDVDAPSNRAARCQMGRFWQVRLLRDLAPVFETLAKASVFVYDHILKIL